MAQCLQDPERECLGLIKAKELEKQISSLKSDASKKREEIFRRLTDVERSSAKIDTHLEHIRDALDTVKTDLIDLKSKPAKRWDSMTDKIIMLIVGAFIAYVLGQIGLS
ncbi:MAG: hypothetical protein Q4A63_07240 [Butyricicoccus pullicaecorum]|nr:hypothetical protein [Butyricicoccus pullicaecorum]MDO4669597.1 hypothetical protein [Butyricicoccus pullicaecorum]